jgi:hypothetical protein
MVAADNREELIFQILEIEMEMFRNISTFERSPCQDRLKTFRLMRWMSHSVLTRPILESYLEDLRQGLLSGRNFMTEKYARMDDLIPSLQTDGVIDGIVAIEDQWMAQVRAAYPCSFPRDGEGFHSYIACELETLSPQTLKLLGEYVSQALEAGRNLVRERYENLFRKLGYASIAEFEEKTRRAPGTPQPGACGR